MSYLVDIDLKTGNIPKGAEILSTVPEFCELINHKDYGIDYLRWIVSIYDYNSPYRNRPESERNKSVTNDIFGKENEKVNDEIVKNAIKKYKNLQYDPIMETYRVYHEKLTQLNEYLSGLIIGEESAEKVQSLLVSQEKLITAMDKVRDRINKVQDTRFMGGDMAKSFLEKQAENG